METRKLYAAAAGIWAVCSIANGATTVSYHAQSVEADRAAQKFATPETPELTAYYQDTAGNARDMRTVYGGMVIMNLGLAGLMASCAVSASKPRKKEEDPIQDHCQYPNIGIS